MKYLVTTFIMLGTLQSQFPTMKYRATKYGLYAFDTLYADSMAGTYIFKLCDTPTNIHSITDTNSILVYCTFLNDTDFK